MSEVMSAHNSNSLTRLQKCSNKIILVGALVKNCVDCDSLRPTLRQLAREQNGNFYLVEIDVNEEPNVAIDLDVLVTPTVLLFKGERLLEKIVGVHPKSFYLEKMKRWVYQTYCVELE
jgi:thioredoxin 1